MWVRGFQYPTFHQLAAYISTCWHASCRPRPHLMACSRMLERHASLGRPTLLFVFLYGAAMSCVFSVRQCSTLRRPQLRAVTVLVNLACCPQQQCSCSQVYMSVWCMCKGGLRRLLLLQRFERTGRTHLCSIFFVARGVQMERRHGCVMGVQLSSNGGGVARREGGGGRCKQVGYGVPNVSSCLFPFLSFPIGMLPVQKDGLSHSAIAANDLLNPKRRWQNALWILRRSL